jgi:hypothetical protein
MENRLSDFHNSFRERKTFEAFAASSCTEEICIKELSVRWVKFIVPLGFFKLGPAFFVFSAFKTTLRKGDFQ